MPRKVIVGVPFYRNRHLVNPLLRSLARTKIDAERVQLSFLFVVDSPDDRELIDELEAEAGLLRTYFPVTLRINEVNLGFVASANSIFADAMAQEADVILLNSDVVVFEDTFQEMLDVGELDHMIGFVGPRTNDTTICTFPLPPQKKKSDPAKLHAAYQQLAPRLPRLSYVPTAVGFCLLVKRKILREFGSFDPIYGAGYNEENDLILRANRCGYRAVIANWSYAYHEGEVSFSTSKAELDAKNTAILTERYPFYLPSVQTYFASEQFRALELTSRLGDSPRLSIAFDFSSFGPHANGTTEYGIKVLKEFVAQFGQQYLVYAICDEAAWDFHQLVQIWSVRRSAPDGDEHFAAVIRLSQPFNTPAVKRVASRGAVVVFSMLDTIAYDCGYLNEPALQHYWSFVAEHSDAVIYISDFSRQQFLARFPSGADVRHLVCMPSTDYRDYAPEETGNTMAKDYVLLLGNHFSHKWVRESVETILREAPDVEIKVLGIELEKCPRVESFASGKLPQQTVDRLYAEAAAVAYPSHYEGFGFPVLHALGHRKVVFVREMPVFREIAERIGNPPNIRFFETTADLARMLKARDFAWVETDDVPGDIGWSRNARELHEIVVDAMKASTARKIEARLKAADALEKRDVFDKATSWHEQLVKRNQEYDYIADYAQRVQDELNRRDVQLAEQVAQAGEWHRRLVVLNAEYTGLAEQAQRIQGELTRRNAQLAEQTGRAEALDAHLGAIYRSVSWRLTGPLRGLARRHSGSIARVRAFSRRYPFLRRSLVATLRFGWRFVTLRWFRRAHSERPAASPVTEAVASVLPSPTQAPSQEPKRVPQSFQPRPIPSIDPGPALERADAKRLICYSHVLSYPPRAGNEYRIHKMLSWLSRRGWDIVVVVCPLPGEMPSPEQMTEAAKAYPKLIVCDRDGTLWHNLPPDSAMISQLRREIRSDIPSLLKEDSAEQRVLERIKGTIRTYCPDLLVDLILHLEDTFRPDAVLAQYVFMTRPFLLPNADVIRLVDTHDVFSSKFSKIERFGVGDSGGLSADEEAALLRPCNLVVAIQPDEAVELKELAPGARVVTAGVDFPVARPTRPPSRPIVLMVASGNKLNEKGLRDFLRFGWPLISRAVPDAEFVVVGAVGEKVLDVPDNVRIRGRVDDLAAVYAEAKVVVNPVIAGTGLKIKTIEAICNLRPLVCWPTGVEGLSEQARQLCHVATDWYAFATEVVRLLELDTDAEETQQNFVSLQAAFSPEQVYAALDEALHAA